MAVRELHQLAMERFDRAGVAQRNGQIGTYYALMKEAVNYELDACKAHTEKHGDKLTLGWDTGYVLLISIMSMAFQSRQWEIGFEAASKALTRAYPQRNMVEEVLGILSNIDMDNPDPADWKLLDRNPRYIPKDCPDCKGDGAIGGSECEYCGGWGTVYVNR